MSLSVPPKEKRCWRSTQGMLTYETPVALAFFFFLRIVLLRCFETRSEGFPAEKDHKETCPLLFLSATRVGVGDHCSTETFVGTNLYSITFIDHIHTALGNISR